MNDTQGTQAQVATELRNIAEGIAPLAVVTLGTLLAFLWVQMKEDKNA